MEKSRFDAFTDGVFAIAITLLVLEIHVPEFSEAKGSYEQQMVDWLLHLGPPLLTYALSFATVGIIWLNHHAAFGRMVHIDRTMTALNLVLLALVCLVPYPTALVARYGPLPASTAFYGIVFFLMGLAYGVLWQYAANLQQRMEGGSPRIAWRQFALGQIGEVTYLAGAAIAFAAPKVAIGLYVATTAFYAMPGIFSPHAPAEDAAA